MCDRHTCSDRMERSDPLPTQTERSESVAQNVQGVLKASSSHIGKEYLNCCQLLSMYSLRHTKQQHSDVSGKKLVRYAPMKLAELLTLVRHIPE
mmetsp:Transcript_2475/g.6744  ORF Transcript_2475/g.6744 Transcript_2475/m.6744 type:complete len:94 (+) Transcript_2475:367-648(+)